MVQGDTATPPRASQRHAEAQGWLSPRLDRAKTRTTSSQAPTAFTEILISGVRIGFQPEYGFPPALPARSKTAPWQASDRYPYRLARPPRRLGSVLIAGQLYTVTNPEPFILFITINIVRLCTGVYRLLKTAKSTRSTRTPAAMNRM